MGSDTLSMIMWLDGASGEATDSSKPQPRYCGRTGFAAPLGHEV